jgi:hypothetical protein
MRKLRVWRQGDVVVREIVEEPRGRMNQIEELVIKSETGKPHVVRAELIYELETREPSFMIEGIHEDIVLEHPEHGVMTIPKGKYLVTTVREATDNSFSVRPRRALD